MILFVIIKLVISFSSIFFLTGYITSIVLEKKHGCVFALDFSDLVFICLLISILLSSISGFILAVSGLFSLTNLIIIHISYCVLLILIFRPSFKIHVVKKSFAKDYLVLFLIIAIAMVLFFHPYEYIAGGWDPGVYVNTGINISRTGSILIHDDFLKELSPEDQKVFSHIRHIGVEKYPGFPITDADKGIITPYFFHLYPVWVAIFYSLGGTKFALMVNAVFGLFSLFAIYSGVKVLFNREAGLISVFLVATNIAQIWQVRFPTTEILTQFLIFSGIYLLALFSKDNGIFFGVLAGIIFAVTFLARIDTILLLPALLIFFYYRSLIKFRKEDLSFISAFTLIMLLVFIYYLTLARLTAGFIINDFTIIKSTLFVIFIIAVSLVLIAFRMLPEHIRAVGISALSSKRTKLVIIILLSMLFLYGCFIRPAFIEGKNAKNLLELSWFLTPIGLAAAFAGLIWLTFNGLDKYNIFFYMTAIFVSLFFINSKMIVPVYMWAVRRFIPVVVPSAAVLTGYFLYRIRSAFPKKGTVIVVLILSGITLYSFITGKGLLSDREYKGLVDFCREFANSFDKEDILVCDESWLATPLHYIHGLNTLQISDQHTIHAIQKCARASQLMYNWSENNNVFYITHREAVFPLDFDLKKVDEATLQSVKMEQTRNRMPGSFYKFTPQVKVFKAVKISDYNYSETEAITIDIGRNAFGLAEGFYRAENVHNYDFRWTGQSASFAIPWLQGSNGTALTIRMSGERPEGIPKAEIKLFADKIYVGDAIIENKMNDYRFYIEPGKISVSDGTRILLKIDSTLWNPYETGISGDNRTLGVQIDKITIEKMEKQ